MSDLFDLTIIGSGPGGYVCAIRAAQLGLNVCIVEKSSLGGICLNWGCIPTKSLLRSAEVFHLCSKSAEYGVSCSAVKPNLSAMIKRSRDVADRLSTGVSGLLKKNKVKVFNGVGSFVSNKQLKVVDNAGKEFFINSENFVIATGARSRDLKDFEPDHKLVFNYKDALACTSLPKSLVVIGSGAIGMEFASFYNTLGSEVTVLEAFNRIMPNEDKDIVAVAKARFEADGIKFATSVKLSSFKKEADSVKVNYLVDNTKHHITAEKVLVAAGVVPNTEELCLHNIGVNLERGSVKIDADCKTNVPNIFAIGDVASSPYMLAHKASHEGIFVAEFVASSNGKFDKNNLHHVNYNQIPACTYTTPQIASFGLTEEKAQEQGRKFRVGRFKGFANGKLIATGDDTGLIKMIFDSVTGEIIGAHFIGHEVTEMIHSVAIAAAGELTDLDLAHTVFPHPTVSEALHESVLDSLNRVIHM